MGDNTLLVKKEAFRNIIAHILRFSHKAIEDRAESVGFCLGNTADNDQIILKNAIPISHGTHIGSQFFEGKSNLLTQMEKKYREQDLDLIGWYISHPSEGLNWLERDIENHLKVQNEERSEAFCLVLDHESIKSEKNFGFKVYRLKDIKKGKNSKIELLNYEIESPNSLDYFKWVQKFVEDFHKRNPILIKEIEEIVEPKPEDLKEIPPEEKEISEEQFQISSEFRRATEDFGDMLNKILNTEINKWMDNFNNGLLLGNKKLVESTEQMNENVIKGIKRLNNWFEKQIKENSRNFKDIVQEYTEKRIQNINNLEDSFKNKSQIILQELVEMLEKKNQEQFIQFKDKLDETKELSEEILSKNSEILKNQEKIQETIQKLHQDVENVTSNILEDLKNQIDENHIEKIKEIETLIKKNEDINQKYSEMEEDFKKLEKAILNYRNL